jgi:hypothetical protein
LSLDAEVLITGVHHYERMLCLLLLLRLPRTRIIYLTSSQFLIPSLTTIFTCCPAYRRAMRSRLTTHRHDGASVPLTARFWRGLG